MRTTLRDPRLAHLLHDLAWAANSEWSLHLRPDDCAYLLAELRKPPSKRRTKGTA